ncbi:hypothetical protein [Shewanella algae]|uniref:hypothetical protein n=1 Tax=Shewanella algae TaxID=38313 RepID=UPI0031F57FC2
MNLKKGVKDTISVKRANYEDCEFNIVHPYLDDHSLHYNWVGGNTGVIIIGLSAKAKKSIEIFKLDDVFQSEARAKLKIYEYLQLNGGLSQLVQAALDYRP